MIPSRPADLTHTDLFGGRGRVQVWVLDTKPVFPFQVALGCELDPDGIVGSHVQEAGLSELIVFVSGHGLVRVGGHERGVGPGEVVSLPEGSTLFIRNTDPAVPLRYLIFKASASR